MLEGEGVVVIDNVICGVSRRSYTLFAVWKNAFWVIVTAWFSEMSCFSTNTDNT